jgi:hypothetical protein
MERLDLSASFSIVAGTHPNKMPFSGVLVHLDRVDQK